MDYDAKLDAILEQTTATNGRVTVLEDTMVAVRVDVDDAKDVLYGDPQRKTPGLVETGQAARDMIRQWRTLTETVKWGAAAITLGLIGNAVSGAIG